MLTLIVALLAAQQLPPAPATPPVPVRRPTATTATVEIRITDRAGAPLEGGTVAAEGPSSRQGVTDRAGNLTFRTVTTGTYRVRAEAPGHIALEKEAVVRTGAMPILEFALSAAPAVPKPEPPPAPAPAPPPAAETISVRPGEPRSVYLASMMEKALDGREAVKVTPVACSGLSRAEMIVVRDTYQTAARPAADEMLYVLAGEASITLAGRTQAVEPSWLTVVPRGSISTVVRRGKGKNPVILLSVLSGPLCSSAGPSQ